MLLGHDLHPPGHLRLLPAHAPRLPGCRGLVLRRGHRGGSRCGYLQYLQYLKNIYRISTEYIHARQLLCGHDLHPAGLRGQRLRGGWRGVLGPGLAVQPRHLLLGHHLHTPGLPLTLCGMSAGLIKPGNTVIS